jgi:hypothetical protein
LSLRYLSPVARKNREKPPASESIVAYAAPIAPAPTIAMVVIFFVFILEVCFYGELYTHNYLQLAQERKSLQHF